MRYATQSDMVDRFGQTEVAQLTDLVNGAVINTAVLGRALGDADAEIDARVGARYALPLASVPPVLVRVAADIARYFLWADAASEQVRNRYKDAIGLLDKIATGHVRLPAAEPLAPGGTAVATIGRSPERQFGADALRAFGPPA